MRSNPATKRRGQKYAIRKVKTPNETGDIVSKNPDFAMATFGIPVEGEAVADEKFLLFRCSVNRIGKSQKMASDECARVFGGFINDVARDSLFIN